MEKNNKTEQHQQKSADSLTNLIWSLSAAALTYMGKTIAPGSAKAEIKLPFAKETIATLDMLKTKTAGNRTPEETKILDELLYELKLAYVKTEEKVNKAKKEPKKPAQKEKKPDTNK
ncbi:hypothetical protein CH330_00735 [candidate division WOR-3 bacterium JGI_Cruoil_03_51_56]|uniref:DUF1844 domain-containing protein n=1 Tax=candidate division WOR-3 bacterium JGI_Cruoil_03_51_56 TaxID=1973747 RepID=A0A235BY49_UNCW3|nr:MAG: hypothetical protein CH330_00735 [candidate division WOR-3 bacterium JGI_Cruoil_03_51_56]